MTKIVNIPQRNQSDIEAEARAWLMRLDGGFQDRRESREFEAWLARSPLHQEAFDRAAATWTGLDGIGHWLGVDARSRKERQVGKPAFLFAAATAAVVVALVAWLAVPLWAPESMYVAEHETSIGEQREVSLPDGSSVELNTDTRITVAIDGRSRLVRLDAGEAWFQVAHDPGRPFVVYASRFAVQATGTAFSVRVDGRHVNLTVTDGRVEIATLRESAPASGQLVLQSFDDTSPRVPLDKGQHAVFDDTIELVSRMAPPEIERSLSWRDGMLIFDDDPLEDVVAEINRYTRQRIVISDSEIQRLRFGGYFHVNDIASILTTFEEDFDIRVEWINDELVYLSRPRGSD